MTPEVPARVKSADDVICQTLDDQIILLNLTSQEYFGLDEVGSHAWKLLLETDDVASAANLLCERFSGDETAIRSDFDTLVRELLEAGLLTPVERTSQGGS